MPRQSKFHADKLLAIVALALMTLVGATFFGRSQGAIATAAETFNAAKIANKTMRIVGGVESTEGAWPWMAALVQAGGDAYQTQYCGGALIAST